MTNKSVQALPDADYLRSRLDYDPVTGILTWRKRRITGRQIPSWNSRWVGKTAGYKHAGYIRVRLDDHQYLAHRIIWKMVFGTDPLEEIYHRNGNPDDNRLGNLREATFIQNMQNKKKRYNATCKLKGVSFNKKLNKYIASIRADQKYEYLGVFNTEEAAHEVWCKAAKRLQGEFARL